MSSSEIGRLSTEQPNPASIGIDTKSSLDILKIINNEDKKIQPALEKILPELAQLVDKVEQAFRLGGRLFYVGAGTSGRLGVLDASECPPTFGTDPQMVQGIIAGGEKALRNAVEGAEDDPDAGRQIVKDRGIENTDILIGITASGQAPYVIGAMKEAASRGAVVGAISCNQNAAIFTHSHHNIFLDVGPEIVTGSTRLKSGTAQKLTLNMITTTAMIRLGKVYNNLMVDLKPLNSKLIDRSKRIIRQATECTAEQAEAAFEACGNPKAAIVMILLGVSAEKAEDLLKKKDGRIGDVIQNS